MASPEQSILGTGWSFPPTFSRGTRSVDMVSDNRDIQESLWILFSTSLGERIMLPEYGTQLWYMVFEAINTTLLTQIEDDIRQAIRSWEARIDVLSVNAQPDADVAGLIVVGVEYLIRSTNSRANLVYPFYLLEGTIPAPAF